MQHDNFISFLSTGQDTFYFDFNISSEDEVEVFLDSKRLEYLNEYTVQLLDDNTKFVKLKNKAGSFIHPVLVILKRNPEIRRVTILSDNTHIQYDLLNLEFDNIISNQQFLNDFFSYINMGLLPNNDSNEEDDNEEDELPADIDLLDARNWKEEINIIDLESHFEIDNVREISIPSPKAFTHNIYLAYAGTLTFPDDYIYKLTSMDKIENPCSITFIIDKKICLYKSEINNIKHKVLSEIVVGKAKLYGHFIDSTHDNIISEYSTNGSSIINLYGELLDMLSVEPDDTFIIRDKYYLDPLRIH